MKETTDKIRAYFKKWEWIVIEWGWKFDVHYCNCAEDMPDDASFNAAGITYSEWSYLSAKIYINVKKMSDLEDDHIEYAVVHELVHLLLAPFRDDNEEMCATTIARVIKMAAEL